MLLNCNSCQKKFVVPDNAITKSGRLVQCGSCGNKWTQFPLEEVVVKTVKAAIKTKNDIKKTSIKKIKPKKNLYTAEYLKKKHGLIISDSSSASGKDKLKNQKKKTSFGFYSYLIVLFVFLIALFGILELSKEIVVIKYPLLELYINYFYDVIEMVTISLTQFIN
tara:strand:- start:551 stop:1045 length:495 start_codon:yes stop_codon:yes gene_type:complete